MNLHYLMTAAYKLGYDISFTIEHDGSMWSGSDDARNYLTDKQVADVKKEAAKLHDEQVSARESALAKLAALGLTDAEIAALVGA